MNTGKRIEQFLHKRREDYDKFLYRDNLLSKRIMKLHNKGHQFNAGNGIW